MTPMRKRMIHELQLQRKSPKTIEAYVTAVAQLARHYGRSRVALIACLSGRRQPQEGGWFLLAPPVPIGTPIGKLSVPPAARGPPARGAPLPGAST